MSAPRVPRFPGNTAVTDLEVYTDAAQDGIRGGSPHLHTVSTEGYAVTAGTGVLHTLDRTEGVQAHPLRAGTVLWFSPGVIHRVENHGGLRVLAIMSTSGLPEAGDAVLTFPPDVLDDPERYARAATLPSGDRALTARAAATRRDLAVTGYGILLADQEARGPAALDEFHTRAVALVAARADAWRERVAATVDETERTASDVAAVGAGSAEHLARGAVVTGTIPEEPAFGMCGLLRSPR